MVIKLDGKSDTPFHLLHRLWTKAVGTPEYNKREWQELEKAILYLNKLGGFGPVIHSETERSPLDRRQDPDELRF